MNSRRKKKLFVISLAMISILLMSFAFFLSDSGTPANSPRMSVSIRLHEIHTNRVDLTWIVKNESDQILTFNENGLIQIRLNGQDVLYPIEAKTLNPGEETCLDVALFDVTMEKANEIEITAASNEGTIATMKQTIYPS